jgi:hypothetical protein
MDRDPNLYDPNSPASGTGTGMHTNTVNTVHDGETRVYDSDRPRGSNTLAYLIGGLVLALGLLAFLFYDGNNSGDVSTTGSTSTQTERSTGAPAGGASTTAPAGGTTAPATPAAPAAPARP